MENDGTWLLSIIVVDDWLFYLFGERWFRSYIDDGNTALSYHAVEPLHTISEL